MRHVLIHPGTSEEEGKKRKEQKEVGTLSQARARKLGAPCRLPGTLSERPVSEFENYEGPRDRPPVSGANLRMLVELEGATWRRRLAEKS